MLISYTDQITVIPDSCLALATDCSACFIAFIRSDLLACKAEGTLDLEKIKCFITQLWEQNGNTKSETFNVVQSPQNSQRNTRVRNCPWNGISVRWPVLASTSYDDRGKSTRFKNYHHSHHRLHFELHGLLQRCVCHLSQVYICHTGLNAECSS